MDKMNDKEVYGLKELRKAGLKMAKHASAIEENTTGLSKLWLFVSPSYRSRYQQYCWMLSERIPNI